MKNIITMTALFFFLFSKADYKNIERAIQNNNYEKTSELLPEITALKAQEKKYLLKLAKRAKIIRKHTGFKFLNSPQDLTRLLAGGIMIPSSAAALLLVLNDIIFENAQTLSNRKISLAAFTLGGLVGLTVGCKQTVKAWSMPKAHAQLQDAKKIKDLIENYPEVK
jgi:hypothetical protein